MVKLSILAFLTAAIVSFFDLYKVAGNQCSPDVRYGDLTIINRLEKSYQSEDIILYLDAHDEFLDKNIGRIAALPGDIVSIDKQGFVLINGTNTYSKTIVDFIQSNGSEIFEERLPEGELLVIENEDWNEADSTEKQLRRIKSEDIQGKIIAIFRRRDL